MHAPMGRRSSSSTPRGRRSPVSRIPARQRRAPAARRREERARRRATPCLRGAAIGAGPTPDLRGDGGEPATRSVSAASRRWRCARRGPTIVGGGAPAHGGGPPTPPPCAPCAPRARAAGRRRVGINSSGDAGAAGTAPTAAAEGAFSGGAESRERAAASVASADLGGAGAPPRRLADHRGRGRSSGNWRRAIEGVRARLSRAMDFFTQAWRAAQCRAPRRCHGAVDAQSRPISQPAATAAAAASAEARVLARGPELRKSATRAAAATRARGGGRVRSRVRGGARARSWRELARRRADRGRRAAARRRSFSAARARSRSVAVAARRSVRSRWRQAARLETPDERAARRRRRAPAFVHAERSPRARTAICARRCAAASSPCTLERASTRAARGGRRGGAVGCGWRATLQIEGRARIAARSAAVARGAARRA